MAPHIEGHHWYPIDLDARSRTITMREHAGNISPLRAEWVEQLERAPAGELVLESNSRGTAKSASP